MAFIYLGLPDTDPGLQTVARSIVVGQEIDIGRMIQMLRDMGAPEAAETDEAMAWMGMPMPAAQMPGMATDAQLEQLAASSGRAADELFVELMVAHHHGGIEMAECAVDDAGLAKVRSMAQSMITGQRGEIAELDQLLAADAGPDRKDAVWSRGRAGRRRAPLVHSVGVTAGRWLAVGGVAVVPAHGVRHRARRGHRVGPAPRHAGRRPAPPTPDSTPPTPTTVDADRTRRDRRRRPPSDVADRAPVRRRPPAPTTPAGDLGDQLDVGDAKPPRDYDDFLRRRARPTSRRGGREQFPDGLRRAVRAADRAASTPPTRSARRRSRAASRDEPTTYEEIAQFSAFYCQDGDFMVYDDGADGVLAQLAEEFGPSILGVVFAHEFGHAIQARAGVLDRDLPTIVTEQQADCFAGAWVAHAAQRRGAGVTFTDADVRSGLVAMIQVRDPIGVDQFDAGRPRLGVRPGRRVPGGFTDGRRPAAPS